MNDNANDFAKLTSQIIAEWPEWKRQYDLRVSSYGPDPVETLPATPAAVPITDPPEEDR